jgi:guanosine-3',5'-bis(diphosphate) 3'-pyrophosphohydrolase
LIPALASGCAKAIFKRNCGELHDDFLLNAFFKEGTVGEPTLKKGEMIDKMIRLAVKGHAGQFDKGGNPYILHVLKVMDNLHTNDEELQCIAVGHDLIEDTRITAKEMLRHGISPRVVTAIEMLTKKKGQTDDEYLNVILSSVDCMRVKKADLQHNSDIRRLKGIRPKDIARIIKYHDMWLKIDARLQSIPANAD